MINNIGTKTIETERLILRKIEISDAKKLHINVTNDSLIYKYFFNNFNSVGSEQRTKSFVEIWLKEYENDNIYKWIIIEKKSNEPIGIIEIIELIVMDSKCEVSFFIGSKFWNKGYTTEALKAVIKFMIKIVGLDIVIGICAKENISSSKVMIKAGMTYDGTLRNKNIIRGVRMDESYYFITKDKLE